MSAISWREYTFWITNLPIFSWKKCKCVMYIYAIFKSQCRFEIPVCHFKNRINFFGQFGCEIFHTQILVILQKIWHFCQTSLVAWFSSLYLLKKNIVVFGKEKSPLLYYKLAYILKLVFKVKHKTHNQEKDMHTIVVWSSSYF